jgi:moderate conductance mechanosensitive channel
MELPHFSLNTELTRTFFNISLTILLAVIADNIFRSFIKVPKALDNRRARTFTVIVRNIITVAVYVIALHVILVELGINITPLLASAGIMGVIIGISARPLIEDLISGLLFLSQDTITIGDYVKIEDIEGVIQSIGARTITIKQDSGALCIIPNGQVKKIINYSRHKTNLFIDLPVKADEKIDAVKEACLEALDEVKKDKKIAPFLLPEATISGIDEFKPTGPLMFRVTLVTSPSMRLEVGRKYRYYVKKAFEKNKIAFG